VHPFLLGLAQRGTAHKHGPDAIVLQHRHQVLIRTSDVFQRFEGVQPYSLGLTRCGRGGQVRQVPLT
jgi:hypothetical protein